jgi:hypothetical protein
MTDRLITHLRHIDLAVPDHAGQVEFYTHLWGLTPVASDTGITFLAAEGSPEPYVLRLRRDTDKRIDLIAFGTANRASVDALATQLGRDGVRLVTEPGSLATPGGGYGFRFFDVDGRTVEVSADVAHRRAPAYRGAGAHSSPAVPCGPQLPESGAHGRLLRAAPRVRALRHHHRPASG